MSYMKAFTQFVNDEFDGKWFELILFRWAAEGKQFEQFYNINDCPVVKIDGRTWVGSRSQTIRDLLRSIDM